VKAFSSQKTKIMWTTDIERIPVIRFVISTQFIVSSLTDRISITMLCTVSYADTELKWQKGGQWM